MTAAHYVCNANFQEGIGETRVAEATHGVLDLPHLVAAAGIRARSVMSREL